jgi:hypothetical protein
VRIPLAAILTAAALTIVAATADLESAPQAAAQPDAQCQDPAFTTAIVFPNDGPNAHSAMVACVPVSVVGHNCRAPLGEPHVILYPEGQGPAPACRSVYDH